MFAAKAWFIFLSTQNSKGRTSQSTELCRCARSSPAQAASHTEETCVEFYVLGRYVCEWDYQQQGRRCCGQWSQFSSARTPVLHPGCVVNQRASWPLVDPQQGT